MADIQTALPPGIYHISVAGIGAESSVGTDNEARPRYLTDQGNSHVTIRPPVHSAHPDHEQEWKIEPGKDGNVIIGRPSNKWPSPYLTYHGAPKKPEGGEKIEVRVFDFPLNEWHLARTHGPGHYFIRPAGSDLGIAIAPLTIYPPILELGHHALEWKFQFVRPPA